MTIGMTIKGRFLLTICVVAVLSSIGMGVYSYQNQVAQLLYRFEALAEQENHLFGTILHADAEGLRRAASGLSRLEAFLAPLAARDRDALLAAARPIFSELKTKHAITHMYFIAPDGTVLLRVHKPEQYGDHLIRATYLQAAATRETASGLEMGKNFFSLRCVTPVLAGGELIGYLEVAEEIDHIFVRMKQITGHDVALFLPRRYIDRFDTGLAIPDGRDFAILYPSSPQLILSSDPKLKDSLQQGLKTFMVKSVEHGGARYVVGVGPIQDAFGDTAGVLFSQKNVTQNYAAIWRGVVVSLAVFAVILASGNLFLWLSMKKSMNFFLAVRNHIQNVTRTWDIDQRLEVATTDEIGELAEDLNRMQDEIGKLKNSLVHQTKELTAANQELDSFVYTVSHDLRTPISAVVGYSDLLKELHGDEFSEEALTLLNTIEQQGEKMGLIVADLLDLATVGNIEPPNQPINTNDVLNFVLIELASEIKKTSLQINVEPLPSVRIPESLLIQIFENLIGNALRYAGPNAGPIEINGTRCGQRVIYSVRDHGMGIPKEEQNQIFEAFYRGSAGKEKAGSGVGLATVQKVCKLYGGNASVEDTPGGGATFRVEIYDAN